MNKLLWKFVRNRYGGVSVILGSLIMTSILITSTGVVLIVSTQNNTRAIERNNIANELHAELLQEMQAFYDMLEAKIPGNPNVANNNPPTIIWSSPIQNCVETASSSLQCKVHVFDPDEDEITIWFYPWGEMVELPLPPVQIMVVPNDTNATFYFDASTPNTNYYWSVAICDPWHIPTSQLFTFSTS
jgi:hypothetical protein